MQIALPPGMDVMIKWRARFVFILVDNQTGQDWSGMPPQDVQFELLVSARSVDSIQDIVFKHAKSVFEARLEDFQSKYPTDNFEARERLSAKGVPIFMFPAK